VSYLSLLDSKLVANLEGLSDHNMGVSLPLNTVAMRQGDMTWNEDAIVMRNADDYMGIVRGPPTILSLIISELIKLRRESKTEGDVASAWCCKILLVSSYCAMGSKHGVLSSTNGSAFK